MNTRITDTGISVFCVAESTVKSEARVVADTMLQLQQLAKHKHITAAATYVILCMHTVHRLGVLFWNAQHSVVGRCCVTGIPKATTIRL